jgi:ribosomal protein L40E
MHKICPDCLGEIPTAAVVCRHCGERVEGKPCRACGARNWHEATLCRWCRQPIDEAAAPGVQAFDAFSVTAQALPTLLQRGRFLPQTITLTQEKIVVITPGPFNLSRKEEEIPWRKVAGFDYRSGIFWDQVTIETRGQSSSRIMCLAKSDGARIREVLQTLEA